MLCLAQSLATTALLLLTAKGYSALRPPHTLTKQEMRIATGLCVFTAMGDLILSAGLGNAGDDGRPVLVQAVFRGTLVAYAGTAAWRGWVQARGVGESVQRQCDVQAAIGSGGEALAAVRERVRMKARLMGANLVGLSVFMFYSIGGWMAAVRWPEWPLLPIICNQVPTILLYLYIVGCIKYDLL